MAKSSPPGGRLLAIGALPFWLTYLTGAVRAIRRQHGQGFRRQATDQVSQPACAVKPSATTPDYGGLPPGQPPSGNARLHHSL